MIMEDELDGEKERKWKRQRSNKWQSEEFTEQRAGFCELLNLRRGILLPMKVVV